MYDPCLLTTINLVGASPYGILSADVVDFDYLETKARADPVASTAINNYVDVMDGVSKTYGDGSGTDICGPRTYT